jgi:hypothetical protein
MKKIIIGMLTLVCSSAIAAPDRCKESIDLVGDVAINLSETLNLANKEGANQSIKDYAVRMSENYEELKQAAQDACRIQYQK